MSRPGFAPALIPGLPSEIADVAHLLGELPGIGPAARVKLAVLLAQNPERATLLAHALALLPSHVAACARCNYLARRGNLCGFCRDQKRDDGLLCVVARVQDVTAIDASGKMRGRYFVLGGLVSSLEGGGSAALPLTQLTDRIRDGVREVLIATPSTTDGDATALVIAERFRAFHFGIGALVVTRLATGVGANSDLSYVDPITLGLAVGQRGTMVG